jgi:hypothetical protein
LATADGRSVRWQCCFDFSFTPGLLLVPLVVLLFPDGRVGTRWKWVLRSALAGYVVLLAGQVSVAAVALERRVPVWGGGGIIGAQHPSGSAAWVNVAHVIILPLFALLCIASVVRQLVSYRRSTGVRRQQLKWLGAGGVWCIVALLALVSNVANSAPGFVWIFIVLGWTALPLSIGVGILRYRLSEIDRLISRTLSYAILTGLLVATFIGLIALTTNTLALSGRVGVAASTLTAAALFNPLRKRVQRLVDRRFNRARYDAEATVAAFTARLRDAVEIDVIRADLLDAVTARSNRRTPRSGSSPTPIAETASRARTRTVLDSRACGNAGVLLRAQTDSAVLSGR